MTPSFVEKQAEYLSVTANKQKFSLLSEQQISRCKITRELHICEHEGLLKSKDSPVACEYLMLFHPSRENLKKCPITIKKLKQNTWIKLTSIDGWLYSLPNQTKVVIHSPKRNPNPIFLKKIGILYLNAGCTARDGDDLLISSPNIGTFSDFIYLPRLHLDIHPKLLQKGLFLARHDISPLRPDTIVQDISFDEIESKYKELQNDIEQEANTNRKTSTSLTIS